MENYSRKGEEDTLVDMYSIDRGMFSTIPIIVIIGFIVVIGVILFVAMKGMVEWSTNNNSPQESVSAVVVTKRTHTSGGSGDSMARTSYYVTFQMESGKRQEFGIRAKEYGMLAEGDVGLLTYQGTRYLHFECNETSPH